MASAITQAWSHLSGIISSENREYPHSGSILRCGSRLMFKLDLAEKLLQDDLRGPNSLSAPFTFDLRGGRWLLNLNSVKPPV